MRVDEREILVEWSHTSGRVSRAGRSETLEAIGLRSHEALEMAMATIRSMAARTSRALAELGEEVRPEEAEIEFGITLDAEAGALIARASTGAQIKVTIKWNTRRDAAPARPPVSEA